MSEFINNNGLQPLNDLISEIMSLPESSLNNDTIESIVGMISGALTPKMREESVQAMYDSFVDQNFTKQQAAELVNTTKQELNDLITELKPSELKATLLKSVFESNFYNIFDEALDRYHNYNFVLPITLEDGAQVPTYAHSTDAAADLYAQEDMTLKAHSQSNMVKTGVRIALPEGWVAFVLPRSSIGLKTGLRLSNSVGVIDSEYRGLIGVIYDNISDSDYEIHKGDRIAQLLIMPNYHFKANVVESLNETSRGDGGFGSSGK